MKNAILALVILAVVAIVAFKVISGRSQPQPTPAPAAAASAPVSAPPTAPAPSAQGKLVLYLFRDASDNDAGCQRIYAYADRAEKDFAGKVDVRRPDVEREKATAEQFHVKVLPTILLVSPNGEVQERFEGEDRETVAKLDQAFDRLKTALQ